MLFANQAVGAFSIGDAAGAVNGGGAQGRVLFDLKVEPRNGPRGTDLAAEIAGMGTVAHTGHQPWSIKPLQAGFPKHGLQAIGETDLHTLAAADTAGEEVPFFLGSRGSDEKFLWSPGQRTQTHQRHHGHPGGQGGDYLAPAQVQGCSEGFTPESKGNSILLTFLLAS